MSGSEEITSSEFEKYERDLIEELGPELIRYIMDTHNHGEFEVGLLHLYDLDSHFRRRVDEGFRELH